VKAPLYPDTLNYVPLTLLFMGYVNSTFKNIWWFFQQARMLQETGWQPKWFRKEKGKDTFEYIGGYWEARKEGHWDNCPDIFGLDVSEPENGTME
jgi:hypothetical protein